MVQQGMTSSHEQRNDKILYYDCSNYYFEIEQEDGSKKEGKEWAPKMLDSGSTKKNHKNPNDPARFIGKIAVTKDGEAADIKQYLDEDKIADDLHETCGFMTDYQFITKSKMRTIQNKSKGKE